MATPIGQGNQPDYSFDKKKISANVAAQVETIKEEGKKIKGSADEVAAFQRLSEELATNGANRHEQNLVKGLIVEYQTKVEQEEAETAQRRQKAEVTPAARDFIKDAKKMMPNKKEFNEAEARMVLAEIRNTRGDWNAADIEYFKQELIKAGFGDLLNELEDNTKTEPAEDEVPAGDAGKPAEPAKDEVPAGDAGKPTEPVKDEAPVEIGKPPKTDDTKNPPSRTDKPYVPPRKGGNPFPNNPAPINNGGGKPTPTPKGKPRITDTAKAHGERIARDLNKEVERPGVSNNTQVHSLVQEVDKNTAYSFLVAYTYADGDRKLDVNQDIYGLSDIFNKITAEDAKHLVSVTLQQAKGMGLQNTKAYANLNQIFNSMNTTLHGKSDPDTALQKRLDQALTSMMNEMTQVVQ